MKASRFIVVSAMLIALAVLASCGTASSTSSATLSPSGQIVLTTATATVGGSSETILTDTSGLTLYYLTSDQEQSPKCVSACLTHWPALSATGSIRGSGVSGTVKVVTNVNGSQVAYNGHLLYRFANDKAPGDTKGEGINAFGGTWHVATPNVTPM